MGHLVSQRAQHFKGIVIITIFDLLHKTNNFIKSEGRL